MKRTLATFLRLDAEGRERAELHAPALEAAYRATFDEADAAAIRAFEGYALVASSEARTRRLKAAGDDAPAVWHVPDADELYPRGEATKRLAERTSPIREAVLTGMLRETLVEFGIDFNLKNPLVAAILHDHEAALAHAVNGHVEDIMQVIRDAHEAGMSVEDTAAELNELGATRSLTAAERWARTEMVGASNGASLAGARLTGVAPYKTWLTAEGARYPRHEDASQYPELIDQTIDVESLFSVGESQGDYPGDPAIGPEDRIYCRCTMTYTDDPSALTAGGTMPDKPRTATASITAASGTATASTAVVDATAEDVATAGTVGEWASPALAQEDTLTRDARGIRAGALSWQSKPLPLMWATGEVHGPGDTPPSILAGSIDGAAMVRDGVNIVAGGVLDDTPGGQAALAQIATGRMGVSVDVAVKGFQIVATSGDPMDAFFGPEPTITETDEGAVMDFDNEAVQWWLTNGEIMGATVVPFAAFQGATIEAKSLTASGTPDVLTLYAPIVLASALPTHERRLADQSSIDSRLTAAALGLAPVRPPVEWFRTPAFDAPTPLTVSSEGRISGHIAPWGTCHIGITGQCREAPRSATGYRYYHLGQIETAEGIKVAVGTLTLDTKHAGDHADWKATARHYDHTGLAAADLRIGEDEHGIWCAGAIRPELDEADVRRLTAAKPSGDWRVVEPGGGLELVGVLAVNTPGFPVIRASAMIDEAGVEHVESLVACIPIPERPDRLALHRRALHARAGR